MANIIEFGSTGNDVSHVREDLWLMRDRYQMIYDCMQGQHAIKEARTTYLPMPNSSDTSEKNLARYNDYLTRSVFYNVVQRTAEGLVGQIFLRNPAVTLDPKIASMELDCDGEGLSITQVLKKACGHVLPYGRGGFLSDFPTNGEGITRKQLSTGEVKPVVKFIKPWDILNWDTTMMGNEEVLSFLVIKENFYHREPGEFQGHTYLRYRVYELTPSGVEVSFHYQTDVRSTKQFENTTPQRLTDANGFPFNHIPFAFVGSENNDARVDVPPLETMSVLNIAHYRNSADYEECVYFIGQPTLFVGGLDQTWVDDVWKGKVRLGARAVIPGPVNSKVDLIQVQPNTMAYEAMVQKEQQMMAVGAKLVERQANVERKEAEIMIEAASDTSILTKIAGNVEAAFLKALEFAGMFVGANAANNEVEVNRNFDLTSLTAEELEKLDTIINSERPMLAFEEVRKILERSGYTCLTLEEAKAAIEEEQKAKLAFTKLMTEAMAPPQPPKEEGSGTPSKSSSEEGST